MSDESKAVEQALQSGAQQDVFMECHAKLKALPRETQIRVLACLLVMLNMDVDVFHRLQATVRR